MKKAGIWATTGALLRGTFTLLRSGGVGLLGILLGAQLLILLIIFPLLRWLFRQALRSNGMIALDLGTLRPTSGFPLTVGLIVVLALVAFWILSLQYTLLVVVLSRVADGAAHTGRELWGEVSRVARKLARPSSLPLIGYLFIVLPLTGFGFTSALIQRIQIPQFISGELAKSGSGALALFLFVLLLIVLCVRLALTLPIFSLSSATGGRAARLSWSLTRRGGGVALVLAVTAIMGLAGVATAIIVVLCLVPALLTDLGAPGASPVVAAMSLGVAQAVALILTALVTAAIAAVLLVYVERRRAEFAPELELRPIVGVDHPISERRRSRGPAITVLSSLVVLAVVLGAAAVPTMQRLSEQPATLVLAHRGFLDGGVENTLGSLEAAARAGADVVEMDVMQTRDHRYVVMHDTQLSRLAGRDVAVKDLTLEEITAITVSDGLGHSDHIPSLAEYVTRAQEVEMPLLIELKFSGAEGPDHVAELIAELEGLDALEGNIYHSLDEPSVTKLKTLRPDLTVGYIMPVAGAGVPHTIADFIVVEEWTATEAMQEAAARAGLGFMVWTVNDPVTQRNYLRDRVDGIITDRPDTALSSRTEMGQESGIIPILADALQRVFTF